MTPDGIRHGVILIRDGVIDGVADSEPPGVPVDDAGDLVLMPGLVDSHVHINEPGHTDWEGFETATKAAAAGGVTTVVDMPLNCLPVTTSSEALGAKLARAAGKLWVDCGFYGGLVPESRDSLTPLAEAGVLGFKAFLCHSGLDEFPNVSEEDLRRAMPAIARAGVPLLVHCELISKKGSPGISRPTSYQEYLLSRPPSWESDAVDLMIRLSKEFFCKVHIVHVSSSDVIPALQKARRDGIAVTAESCPHYLCFASEEIDDGDTRFKCAPPIRDRENRERLWEALRTGVIDCVVSDHSPCPPDLKAGDFQSAWGGISSLQFGLPVIWTQAMKRGFSIPDVAKWMCRNPAELAGLSGRKGVISPGYDADLVAWDPEGEVFVDSTEIHHRHKVTPYDGMSLTGKVFHTYVRGHKVFDDGAHVGEPRGRVLTRSASEKVA